MLMDCQLNNYNMTASKILFILISEKSRSFTLSIPSSTLKFQQGNYLNLRYFFFKPKLASPAQSFSSINQLFYSEFAGSKLHLRKISKNLLDLCSFG